MHSLFEHLVFITASTQDAYERSALPVYCCVPQQQVVIGGKAICKAVGWRIRPHHKGSNDCQSAGT